MFLPVLNGIYTWRTQDPEYDWEMVGHLLSKDEEIILVDPPYVHGLEKALPLIGKAEAIVLTTANHTRGSRYLSYKLQIPIYAPLQADSFSVSPKKMYEDKGINNYKIYEEGSLLWLKTKRVTVWRNDGDKIPYLDEMILIDENRSVITGDIAMGSYSGELLTINEGFTDSPDVNLVSRSRNVIIDSFSGLHLDNLLSSHGYDIIGNLNAKIS